MMESIKRFYSEHSAGCQITLLLVFAYIIRVIYPQIFMIGGDMPGHVMAALRLDLSSPFEIHTPIYNTIGQLLQFNHGYTTVLFPYVFYKIFFGFLNITINEVTLTFVNNLFGIISIFTVYYFLKMHFGHRKAILAALLFAVLPIHIGLSRVMIGTQIIQSIFFFASLIFLGKYLYTDQNKYKILYFITTLFYIGSDNLFFIGLFMHLAYVYIVTSEFDARAFVKNTKKVYFNVWSLICIVLPILAYAFVTYYSMRHGITSGFILRLFSKTDQGLSFDILYVLKMCLALVGPCFLLLIYSLFNTEKIKNNKIVTYLTFYFVSYFLIFLLKSGSAEKNYIFFLTVPICMLYVEAFYNKRFFKIIYTVFLIATLIYSFSVVYGLNIGFSTINNFGSVNKNDIANNDYGMKALGYLVRSGEIEVSEINSTKYGIDFIEKGVLLRFEGAYYYLGDFPIKNESDVDKFDKYIVASFDYWNADNNQNMVADTKDLNLDIYGYIVDDQNRTLVRIYSNYPSEPIKIFNNTQLNERFDNEYGNINKLTKINLGHY